MSEKNAQKIESAELRRRAEQRLEGNAGSVSFPETGVDQLRLIHELQVHQIELEIQNEELRQAREEVEASLDRYEDLYDFAPVGYITLDINGIIRSANLTGSSLIGIERSKLIGLRFESLLTAGTRSLFTTFFGKVITSLAKSACEVMLKKEGTSERIVQIEGVVDTSGKECRVALIDITESKRADEANRLAKEAVEVLRQANIDAETLLLENETAEVLRQANKKAEDMILANEAAEALYLAKETADKIRMAKEKALKLHLAKESAESSARIKSQFFANMSHELRTPMTGILGMIQIALEESQDPAQQEYLETTLSSARSLLLILNDILDMSKIEAGKLTIKEEPFSLQGCIAEAVNIITPEVHRKGLDFAFMVSTDEQDMVVGDQARLRQIILNLIGNAVKFTEVGKVELQVTAGRMISAGNREFTFTVTDTGIGIPEDKQGLLFQTFSQVDASHTRIYGGSGLGLAISRDIVELMGGTITFASKEGDGSTFSFTIPLAKARLKSDAITEAKPPLFETVTAPERKGIPHLLLAEDDPSCRRIVELMLMRNSYTIDSAEDGQKAVEMWEKGKYDLILMDIQMPRLNGFEATCIIREKEQVLGVHTPIVAITAHAGKVDEERCLAAGMDAFVPKPIDFKECLQVIAELIKQRSPRVC